MTIIFGKQYRQDRFLLNFIFDFSNYSRHSRHQVPLLDSLISMNRGGGGGGGELAARSGTEFT